MAVYSTRGILSAEHALLIVHRSAIASGGAEVKLINSDGMAFIGPGSEWNISLGYTFSCLIPPTPQPYAIDTQGSGEVLVSPLQG